MVSRRGLLLFQTCMHPRGLEGEGVCPQQHQSWGMGVRSHGWALGGQV